MKLKKISFFFSGLRLMPFCQWKFAQDYGEVPVINTRGLQGVVWLGRIRLQFDLVERSFG